MEILRELPPTPCSPFSYHFRYSTKLTHYSTSFHVTNDIYPHYLMVPSISLHTSRIKSRYPSTLLMVFLHITEHPPQYCQRPLQMYEHPLHYFKISTLFTYDIPQHILTSPTLLSTLHNTATYPLNFTDHIPAHFCTPFKLLNTQHITEHPPRY